MDAMQRMVTADDALDVIAAVAALHDASNLPALFGALPRLLGDLVPHDAIDVHGSAADGGVSTVPLDYRLAIATPDSGGVLTGIVLGRHTRPFGTRDAAIAGLLGPLVGAAADHVRLRMLHADGEDRLRVLTLRERQVLALVSEGRSSRDIAEALFIERRTVEKHVEHIKAKLGAHSRAEAAAAWARAVALAS
jgi:DNA-binding CsgD family transcriptional regulator